MYYIHYNENGEIISVANHNNAKLYIETSEVFFNAFQSGHSHLHEYRVIEDIKIKGRMHVVSTEYNDLEEIAHTTGLIKQSNITKEYSGIQIIQNKASWTVNNFIDSATASKLSISNPYIKEYYIVDKTNRYVLLDKFNFDLTEFVHKKSINIKGCSADKKVCIVTKQSHIDHIHTTGKTNENN